MTEYLTSASNAAYRFARAVTTKDYRLRDLNTETYPLTAVRLAVQAKVLAVPVPSEGSGGDSVPCLFLGLWWFGAILGMSWLVDASFGFLP